MFLSDNKVWIKISALVVAIAMAVLIICAVIGIYDVEPYRDTHILNDHWNIQWNEERYENVSLKDFVFASIKRGDQVVLTTVMPDVVCEQPYMQLRVWHSTIGVILFTGLCVADLAAYQLGNSAREGMNEALTAFNRSSGQNRRCQ